MRKFLMIAIAALSMSVGLTACEDAAKVASQNVSKAADNFEVNRRIVFYNGVTNEYMLVIEGYCSQEPDHKKLAVICKDEHGKYKKHFLYMSDNVSAFSEQLEPVKASEYRYRVTFRPSVIVPDIRVPTN